MRKAEVPALRSLEASAGDSGRHEWSQSSEVAVTLQEGQPQVCPVVKGHHPGADERQKVQDVWKGPFCRLPDVQVMSPLTSVSKQGFC